MQALLIVGLLSVASPADKFFDTMERNHHLDREEVCDAFKRLTLKKRRAVPECRVDRSTRITKVKGNKCDVHYTIHGKTCQCNNGSTHSEQIAVKAGAKRMANQAFPCKAKCYPFLISQLAKKPSLRLHIAYAANRPDSAQAIHKDLAKVCD